MKIDLVKLKKEQLKLAKKIIVKDGFEKVERIAGCDQAFFSNEVVSAIVVCDKDLEILEKKYAVVKVMIEYIPSYLCFREGPVIIEAFRKLEKKPDILLVEGHGITHLRLGLASYVGIILDQPTIGIAKNLLHGTVKDGKVYIDDEVRGFEFMSREASKPLYISPGYKVSLKSSLDIVKKYFRYPHKLPEPLFLAHKYANELRKSLK